MKLTDVDGFLRFVVPSRASHKVSYRVSRGYIKDIWGIYTEMIGIYRSVVLSRNLVFVAGILTDSQFLNRNPNCRVGILICEPEFDRIPHSLSHLYFILCLLSYLTASLD